MSVVVHEQPGLGKRDVWRIYGWSAVITAAIWLAITVSLGFAGLFSVVTLTALEVTFSFDNAVVNSRFLKIMSPFWQRLFLTVGIFIAVFVVRFALPIFIVQLTSGLGFSDVITLALNQPEVYAEELHTAGPLIDSFGGTFLVMIGISYFIDHEKDEHWLNWLESRLAPIGRFDNVAIFFMMALTLIIYVSTGGQTAVLVAGFCGLLLHIGLDLFGSVFDGDEDEDNEPKASKTVVKTGTAAFVLFLRLEVLDASFSFDGVIGAFAITTSVIMIMAGLGAGAMWVRSMTVHLVRAGTLAKYRYLEHGAHWAILALGLTMLGKLYHVELPEAAVGSIGLVFIGFAVISSVRANRRDAREAESEEFLQEAEEHVEV